MVNNEYAGVGINRHQNNSVPADVKNIRNAPRQNPYPKDTLTMSVTLKSDTNSPRRVKSSRLPVK